jgi:hypothetical protein
MVNRNETFKEHVCTVELPRRFSTEFLESQGNDLPQVIYPEIRVLTADKATRNKTFYPEASLRGRPKDGTGLISFIRPYPVPIIQDHNTGGGMCGGPSSEVYGRVHRSPSFIKDLGEGYIRAIPAITDADAIEKILTQRWLTVSLGSRVENVTCNICQTELTETECEHVRGKVYEVGEGKEKRKVEALWVLGPIRAKEISFVVTPSDEQAGVLTPNIEMKESFDSGRLSRLLVGNQHGVYDLLRGTRIQETAVPLGLQVPSVQRNFFFKGWR